MHTNSISYDTGQRRKNIPCVLPCISASQLRAACIEFICERECLSAIDAHILSLSVKVQGTDYEWHPKARGFFSRDYSTYQNLFIDE